MNKYICINDYQMSYVDGADLKLYQYTIRKGMVLDVQSFDFNNYIICFDDKPFLIHRVKLNKHFESYNEVEYSDKSDKYLKFIEKHEPSFERRSNGKMRMFTCVTQHIERDTVKELLDYGIECDKEFNGKSPMNWLWERLMGSEVK